MQAISKEKHDRFCKLMKEIKFSLSLEDKQLIDLESELETVFKEYKDSFNELKALIMEYYAKEKAIREKLKQLMRSKAPKQATVSRS